LFSIINQKQLKNKNGGIMIHVKFKNLEKSEMAREVTLNRVEPIIEKFPDLKTSQIQVTLEMDNSPTQAGPDLFKVRLHLKGGRYKGITIEKAHQNLYTALAELTDHMLEALNRFGDKIRVKQRRSARQFAKMLQKKADVQKDSIIEIKG
jgi:ribosome-associated translation inhibitor RaiA